MKNSAYTACGQVPLYSRWRFKIHFSLHRLSTLLRHNVLGVGFSIVAACCISYSMESVPRRLTMLSLGPSMAFPISSVTFFMLHCCFLWNSKQAAFVSTTFVAHACLLVYYKTLVHGIKIVTQISQVTKSHKCELWKHVFYSYAWHCYSSWFHKY